MTDEADKESTAEAAESKQAAAESKQAAAKSKQDSPESKQDAVETSKEPDKPEADTKKQSEIEKTKSKVRILTGALVVVVLVFIYVVFRSFEVMKEVRNPNSQYARPERQTKQPTQAELEADELKFQPKAVVPIPKDSPVMHEHLKTPERKTAPKAK